jgi:nitrile hydratase
MTTLPEIISLPFPPPYPTRNACFAPGDTVRVRRGDAPGHIRTPWYLRGCTGRIERICGDFANPEELAYRRDGRPVRALYRVRFTMAEVWGGGAERGQDAIDAEIFEHWLEAADAP